MKKQSTLGLERTSVKADGRIFDHLQPPSASKSTSITRKMTMQSGRQEVNSLTHPGGKPKYATVSGMAHLSQSSMAQLMMHEANVCGRATFPLAVGLFDVILAKK